MSWTQHAWLRIGLRELFLLTVIAALSLALWKQLHPPEFVNSGLVDAVNQALTQKLSADGQVLSHSSMNTVNDNKVWQFSHEVTSTGKPISRHAVLSKILTVLREQAAKSQCTLDSTPGSGPDLSLHCQYGWQNGRGTAQLFITAPSDDKVAVNLVFFECAQ